MKKIIVSILIFWVFVYLIISFIKWNLNCQLWTQDERAGYVVLVAAISPLIGILIKAIDSEL